MVPMLLLWHQHKSLVLPGKHNALEPEFAMMPSIVTQMLTARMPLTLAVAVLIQTPPNAATVKLEAPANLVWLATPRPLAQPLMMVKHQDKSTASNLLVVALVLVTTITTAMILKVPTACSLESAWTADPMLIVKVETHGTETTTEKLFVTSTQSVVSKLAPRMTFLTANHPLLIA